MINWCQNGKEIKADFMIPGGAKYNTAQKWSFIKTYCNTQQCHQNEI